VTINVAFTYRGLRALGVPTRTLREMPSEYMDGMAARAKILGDHLGKNHPDNWDPVWRSGVHVAVAMRSQMNPDGTPVQALEDETRALDDLCRQHGIQILKGHGPTDAFYQQMSALGVTLPDGRFQPLPIEHFGFTDGISEVAFEEQGAESRVPGGGKIMPDGSWAPLETGEFLLGLPDESQEVAPAAMPQPFTRNGTFMAYRKLHENAAAFRDYIARTAVTYAAVMGGSVEDAAEIIRAKMAGRWSDGVPLTAAPTLEDRKAFHARAAAEPDEFKRWVPMVDFRYKDDPEGVRCPLGSHIRRVNTRDMMDPSHTSVLNNRRRILRRGLPYGKADPTATDDSGEHGVVFLAYCADLFRQFEFIQQQWLQYGLDVNAGNDTCPLLGNRDGNDAKFVIPSDPASGKPPFICANLPQFVEMRGGDYFFVPSMTALRMIGMGVVDPT
jgi:Dyp-type peroxidase family